MQEELSTQHVREALTRLVTDVAELERLEDTLSQFNIFEAVGAVRQELRHSDFLSWLLTPTGSHGLGDTFIKRLLQRATSSPASSSPALNPIELDVLDLSDTQVVREWSNIDILLRSDSNRFVVVIENKVTVGEREGQLETYRRKVETEFPDYRRLLLFLSIDGDDPSNESYLPISYSLIHDLLVEMLARRRASLAQDVAVTIEHYIQMLRRHYVSDSDLAKLAEQLYQKHKLAFDYVFEQIPDVRMELQDRIEAYVTTQPNVVLDNSNKSHVRFIDRSWDDITGLRACTGWTGTGRMLLVEVLNFVGRVRIAVVIGPGPGSTRQAVYDAFRGNAELNARPAPLAPSFARLWSSTLLKYDEEASPDEIMSRLKPKLDSFLQGTFPVVSTIVRQAFPRP